MIPILDLSQQYQELQGELEEAVLKVMRSTRYILGEETQKFEQEFAQWHDPKALCTSVANGTDALQLAVRALDLKAGDEVICPSFTFIATAGAIALTGATPVFADISPQTFNLDPQSLQDKITPNTKAIIVVHLYGQAVDMDLILDIARRNGLKVIEDVAQACGALYKNQKAGTFGDLACYSFFPTKNLGCMGDGGAILTADPKLDQKLKMLRNHGSKERYYHEILGTNSRLDEIQAAVLRIKLKHLDRFNQQRREAASNYDRLLSELPVTSPYRDPNCHHVFHQYTITCPQRDQLKEHLASQQVGAMIYYPVSLHQQNTFLDPAENAPLAHCEKVQQEVLSLPIFPEITLQQQEKVARSIASFYQN